jgi:hypothetical protein
VAADPVAEPAGAGDSTAAKVRAQLAGDFPPGALTWLDTLDWRGPVLVPLRSLDFSRSASWAAAGDKAKVARFTARIRAGWRKPAVLVKTPDGRITPVDGHTRLLACRILGQPVPAWVGYAKANHGPWEKAHARQNP